MESSQTSYFTELIKKFDFIQSVFVTDYEGAMIASSQRSEEYKENNSDINTSLGDDKQQVDIDRYHKIKISLSYQLNSALDQISKIEKWKTRSLVTVYDTVTIFQAKINKTIMAHFICDSKNFNYEIIKEIVSEIQEKLQKVEKEIENLTQINDAN